MNLEDHLVVKVSCVQVQLLSDQNGKTFCKMHTHTSVFMTHLGHLFTATFVSFSELAKH